MKRNRVAKDMILEEEKDLSLVHYKLFSADAVRWLSSLQDSSVDLIVTDPPYESQEKWRKQGTTTRLKNSKSSSNEWFEIFPNSRFPELFQQCYRVLKKNTHFYMFCDAETMFVVKPILEESGFNFHKFLVWNKMAIGTGYHYRALYELILFLSKGKRNLKDRSIPDILTAKRIFRGFPAEKPYSIAETFIKQSSDEGDLVIDPFCGSGSVGEAALRNGRSFWGNDLSEKAISFASTRLKVVTGNP